MTIVPDTKDWTWVLDRPCAECGLDTRALDRQAVPAMIRANATDWRAVLTGSGDVRQRPAPDVWSPLEYGCHVRDVFRRYDERLRLMLVEDDPEFPNWDQDATAVAEHYTDQDPAEVAAQLAEAAEQIAATFDGVTGEQWQRTGGRSDGARFTIDTLARYLVHDVIHHIDDVSAG
ncbi:MAG: DinB family protein [Actinobacteria bacterium]|nr:DinB family protein [Actinomycetota bacterium]MBI3686270.1 DinB family protein [Actinomycetota bacterium]